MGTNYYAVRTKPTVREPIHIGKSSWGWLFAFQYQDEPYNDPPVVWHNYDEVKAWLKKYTVDSNEYVIMDEEDETVPYDEFVALVEKKQKEDTENPDNFTYSDNILGYRFNHGWFI